MNATTTITADHETARTPRSRRRQPTFSLDNVGRTNLCELARRTGYPVRTLQRWNTTGIPRYSADRLAIRLGRHPASIWDDWYDER